MMTHRTGNVGLLTLHLCHLILLVCMPRQIRCACPTPPVYPDKTHSNYDASYSTGDTATYNCNPGYDFKSGEKISTCQSDGAWTTVSLHCELGSCSSPGPLLHGTRSGDDFRVFQQVTFSCNTGYSLKGDSVSTCTTRRTWSNSLPLCEEITCSKLTAPQHGSIQQPNVAGYDDTATVTCDNDYMYSEPSRTRRCATDGWTGNTGTCTEIDCGTPTLYNGKVEVSTTKYAGLARYSCNPGTTREDSADLRATGGVSTCHQTGNWIPLPPTCNLDCPTSGLPDVTHGVISNRGSTQHPHKTELRVSCDTGFTPQGADRVTCNNGTWTPSEAITCKADGNGDFEKGMAIGIKIGLSIGIPIGFLICVICIAIYCCCYIPKRRQNVCDAICECDEKHIRKKGDPKLVEEIKKLNRELNGQKPDLNGQKRMTLDLQSVKLSLSKKEKYLEFGMLCPCWRTIEVTLNESDVAKAPVKADREPQQNDRLLSEPQGKEVPGSQQEWV